MTVIAEEEQAQRFAARDPSLLVAVTLSGGGARAAAFGYGVLRELRDTVFDWNGRSLDLLDATDVNRRRLGRQHHRGLLRRLRSRRARHLVDGGVADNLGVRRLLDRALAASGLRESFHEVKVPPGSVRRLVIFTVNAESESSEHLDASDETPGNLRVLDALRFGAGSRATHETQEFLADLARKWGRDPRPRPRAARSSRPMPASTSSR